MSTFRFRAAVVLELRSRQERDAAAVLSRAEMSLVQARTRVSEAIRARQDAQTVELDRQRQGATSSEIEWHRNWITRLASTVEERRAEFELRQSEVRTAEQAWRGARQRLLTIERMRERAWAKFQRAEQREEMKVIDELVSLRYGAPDIDR
jgi:flagellar export protein FliJ